MPDYKVITQYPTESTENSGKIVISQERSENIRKGEMNAILYVNRDEIFLRFRSLQAVYYCFRKWKFAGMFGNVMDSLLSFIRK